MSDEPKFLEGLQSALTQLNVIDDNLTKNKQQREILRDKIRAWMDTNDLKGYETFDSNGDKLWRLSINSSNRRSADFTYLEQTLNTAQLDQAVKHTEVETFKCAQVKTRKKKSSPTVPTGV